MKIHDIKDAQFLPASFCSRDGRLFVWQDKLYRAITQERSIFFTQLFQNHVISNLVNKGFLIDSEATPIQLEGYGLVVSHRRLPFVTYPFEWCDEMLKEAALLLLDLNIELLRFGLMTHDAHPWNILFDNSKPVFIDLGSLILADTIRLQVWIEEFSQFFLRPLCLFSVKERRLARLFLQDWKLGVQEKDFIRIVDQSSNRIHLSNLINDLRSTLPESVKSLLRPFRRKLNGLNSSSASIGKTHHDIPALKRSLEDLRQKIESLELPKSLDWPDYYDTFFAFPSFTSDHDWTMKHQGVAGALDKVKPKTVLDIGSNRGWYSQLAAYKGVNVVAIDIDEPAVSALYRDSKSSNLTILPLVLDFVWPSPGYGLLNFWAPATERFQCEFVIALALVHHLVHSQAMQFDHIIEGLAKFTTDWLLVEFIPYEDPILQKWNCSKLEWYNIDNFLKALKKFFIVHEVIESDPLTRALVLCKKSLRDY